MPLNPPQAYRKTRFIHRRGTRADQPLASNVLNGTLYFVTDELVLERSNGLVWETYSGSGTSGDDYVVMSDGAVGLTPPSPVHDGDGNFIYIPYTP